MTKRILAAAITAVVALTGTSIVTAASHAAPVASNDWPLRR